MKHVPVVPASAAVTSPDGKGTEGTVVAASPLPEIRPGLLLNSFAATASGVSVERIAGREVAPQQEGDQWKGNMPYQSKVLVSVEAAPILDR